MNAGGRFTTSPTNGIVCDGCTSSNLRRSVDLGQREFAALLSVPLETLRTWDSGRRRVPTHITHRAGAVVCEHKRRHELLPLAELATLLDVHIRTLQAAARTGRLEAHFSV